VQGPQWGSQRRCQTGRPELTTCVCGVTRTCCSAAVAQVLAEFSQRKDRLLSELDFVFADVLTWCVPRILLSSPNPPTSSRRSRRTAGPDAVVQGCSLSLFFPLL
jgi:hypothetical protein